MSNPQSPTSPQFDVITFGECMLRFSPPAGQMLEQADQLRVDPAGTESNTAVALARLGRRVSWFSLLPDTPLGRWITTRLDSHGVDVSHVIWTGDRVGVFFLEPGTPPRGSRVVYDRADAAVSILKRDIVDWDIFANARIVHTTGITAALSDSCRIFTEEALQKAGSLGCRTSFDINYRAKLWSPDEAAHTLTPILHHVDILISTIADVKLIFNIDGSPEQIIQELSTRFNNEMIILTLAEGGAVGWSEDTGFLHTGPHSVEQVDRLGAGDAFDAGLLYGILQDDLESGLSFGAALAALSYSEQGDVTWSTLEEVRHLAGLVKT
ncbi:MAG TPA: sugar kinase [candidate division Zixibacteria bacterium]|nr:sugar kinase [candidate division Zixibacteria bacterium]